MRKIKRFKISTRQKEITRKVMRLGLDLSADGLTDEITLTRFIVNLSQQLDPGTVYELNENVLWDLPEHTVAAQGMFSACAVTLGTPCTEHANTLQGNTQLAAQTVLFEFLRTATLFVLDLIKEQAEKEEYETQEPQFVYVPKIGLAPVPKLFQDFPCVPKDTALKILPELLKRINSDKIDVTLQGEQILPAATVIFIVPWQKKRRKGKK